MQLCKALRPDGSPGVGVVEGGRLRWLDRHFSLSAILHGPDPARLARDVLLPAASDPVPLAGVKLLPPLDEQEVWAAGVTYKRSRIAREQESQGAAQFYDKVYTADRPELFFKSPAWRVVAPGDPVRIRADGRWNVPEPELALVVSPGLRIVGYTVGNDVSSRDIEGENPLYLPQAKFYRGSCAVGPVVTLADAFPPAEQVTIELRISRGGRDVFAGSTSLAQMARPLDSLVSWLGRELDFPHGAVLLTGTGIVPPDDFTLAAGDVIDIGVAGVGRLVNPVG